MQKLLLKILLFFCGLCTFVVLMQLIPKDTFTFRSWESVIWVEKSDTIGRFYPNIKSVRDESGDLGHNSKYNVLKKNIYWETDKYGFRNDQSKDAAYDIVLVGDSNSVGSGTTQEQILSKQISRRIGSNVFNYAPMEIDGAFLANLSDMGINPKVVIYEKIEREIPKIAECNDQDIAQKHRRTIKDAIEQSMKSLFANNLYTYVLIARDRFYKKEPVNFIQGKIDSSFGRFNMPVSVGEENILFFDSSFATKEIQDDKISLIADKLEKLSIAFNKRGIKFIFVPVPNKESIYVELLPENKQPIKNITFLSRLKKELDTRGVTSVDTYSLFRSSFQTGTRMYFADDTHWNSVGIELTSDLVAREIGMSLNRR